MKSIGFIIAVLAVGVAICGGGYGVKYTHQQADKARNTLDANQKKAEETLTAKLTDTRSRYLAAVNRVNAEVRDPLAPAFLVQKLNNLEGSLLNDRTKNHLAFYCLQGLADVGTNAIPAIKDYFVGYADTELKIPYYRSPPLVVRRKHPSVSAF